MEIIGTWWMLAGFFAIALVFIEIVGTCKEAVGSKTRFVTIQVDPALAAIRLEAITMPAAEA